MKNKAQLEDRLIACAMLMDRENSRSFPRARDVRGDRAPTTSISAFQVAFFFFYLLPKLGAVPGRKGEGGEIRGSAKTKGEHAANERESCSEARAGQSAEVRFTSKPPAVTCGDLLTYYLTY